MKKINFTIYILICVAAFVALVFGKLHFIGRYFVESNSGSGFTYGDMYDMAEIKSFKEPIEVKASEEKTKLQEAKLFALGDSFFQTTLESENFANMLETDIGLPVYNIVQQSDDYVNVANPLIFLQQENIEKGDEKVLILESVDWRSERRALNYLSSLYKPVSIKDKLSKLVFDNSDVEYFVRRNKLTNSLRQTAKNWEYEFLNEVDLRVGEWDRKSGMIFYFEEVLFHKKPKSFLEIERMAKNISELSKKLYDQYNIKLLYLNMPSKYALYGNDANKDFTYDGFGVNLQKALEEKGVSSIDVYSLYARYKSQNPDSLLYYKNDSHFTPLGKQLLIEAVGESLKKM